ncbi:MAG: hypothetical protein PHE83_05755 [Opitutaceae bacterium]|nr:hypothetical protein [Opitutaceae bacterium]
MSREAQVIYELIAEETGCLDRFLAMGRSIPSSAISSSFVKASEDRLSRPAVTPAPAAETCGIRNAMRALAPPGQMAAPETGRASGHATTASGPGGNIS